MENSDRCFLLFLLWIKPLLCSHPSNAALILTFEKKSMAPADLPLWPVSLFLSCPLSCPHVPHLLISPFFFLFFSLNCCASPCHQQQGEMAMSVFFLLLFFHFGQKKGGSAVSCHRIKRRMHHGQMCASMKWQRSHWTLEWLSEALQLGSQFLRYENPDILVAQRSWCTWNSNDEEMQKQTFLGQSQLSVLSNTVHLHTHQSPPTHQTDPTFHTHL